MPAFVGWVFVYTWFGGFRVEAFYKDAPTTITSLQWSRRGQRLGLAKLRAVQATLHREVRAAADAER
jgi:hypothetical protein